jgi:hypothetical protein
MPIHDWWVNDTSERFWMETTGRSDIGANLLAPQEDESGNANNPGYLLVTYVNDGDVVLHWNTNSRELVSWSRAVGGVWSDRIVWASVPGGGTPFDRPAWVHGLEGPFDFPQPITLADVRAQSVDIERIVSSRSATRRASLLPVHEVRRLMAKPPHWSALSLQIP